MQYYIYLLIIWIVVFYGTRVVVLCFSDAWPCMFTSSQLKEKFKIIIINIWFHFHSVLSVCVSQYYSQ
jgi:hypothetical protein